VHVPALLAHAAWFAEAPSTFDLAALGRPATVAAVLMAILTALVWRRVAGGLPSPELRSLHPLGRLAPLVPRLVAAHLGIALLALAARGAYLAPSLAVPPTRWGYLLTAVEVVVGCWLLVGLRVRPAAWLLVSAGPLGMVTFGVLPIAERLDVLGIALFLALLPPDDAHPAGLVRFEPARLRPALLVLRTLVGGALVVVAVTEKLARPELTLRFLAEHPEFNVAQLVGLPVSDELFVQLAGGIEILVGLLLISGALPQVVVLLAAGPFVAGLPLLGVDELVGHLPIYGVLLALLLLGSRADTAAACSWLPRWTSGDDRRTVAEDEPTSVELAA
jgi:hypothetical protein